MKQRIMEALLDSETLTKDEILWAASHLPESSEKGKQEFHYVFQHDKKDIYEAINIDVSEVNEAGELLAKVTKSLLFDKDYSLSMALESLIKERDNYRALFPLILVKTINSAVEEVHSMLKKAQQS